MWERGSTSVVLTFSSSRITLLFPFHIPSMHVYFNLIPHVFFSYLSLHFWDTKRQRKNCFNWYIAHVEFLIGHWINEMCLRGHFWEIWCWIIPCLNELPMSMMWVELNDWLLIIAQFVCACGWIKWKNYENTNRQIIIDNQFGGKASEWMWKNAFSLTRPLMGRAYTKNSQFST